MDDIAFASGQFDATRNRLRWALPIDSELGRTHVALAQFSLALCDQQAANRHRQAPIKSKKTVAIRDPLSLEFQRAGATRIGLLAAGYAT